MGPVRVEGARPPGPPLPRPMYVYWDYFSLAYVFCAVVASSFSHQSSLVGCYQAKAKPLVTTSIIYSPQITITSTVNKKYYKNLQMITNNHNTVVLGPLTFIQ